MAAPRRDIRGRFAQQGVFLKTDTSELGAILGEMADSFDDATPYFEAIQKDVLIPAAIDAWAQEGRTSPWPELADSTIRKKGHNRILEDTGDLKESLTTESGNQFSIRTMTKKAMEFGTTRPYAGVHQSGSKDGRIPRRTFLEVTDSDMDTLVEIAMQFYFGSGRFAE